MLYPILRSLLFRLPAERAHQWTTALLDSGVRISGMLQLAELAMYRDPVLMMQVGGLHVANPIGLAAGFDKDGTHSRAMAALGFGFLELGTVTPRPQPGNPQPRLFRLPADRAIINRMGFNNTGVVALTKRLRNTRVHVPVGVNIGKNKSTPNESATADYVICLRHVAPFADYVVVNISSPNTPGLRALSQREPLSDLLYTLQAERQHFEQAHGRQAPSLWLKIAPDEPAAQLDVILDVALATNIAGLIATNTTVARPALRSSAADEMGGLSGRPLRERAQAVLAYLYRATSGQLPLIGVGGIEDGRSAYERVLAGASLLQLYTALIYRGPRIVHTIARDLASLLRADGYPSLAAAVGAHAHLQQMT